MSSLAVLASLVPTQEAGLSTTTTSRQSQAQINTPSQASKSNSQNTQHTFRHSDPSQESDSKYFKPLPDKPIQLVRPDPTEHLKLEIVEENVRHLHHINSAVAVVAVVGKFHSGKSFLLNQLMGKQEGFGIGPYVRPQTMGIWMWGKVR